MRDIGGPVGFVVPEEYGDLAGHRHVGGQAEIVVTVAHGAVIIVLLREPQRPALRSHQQMQFWEHRDHHFA